MFRLHIDNLNPRKDWFVDSSSNGDFRGSRHPNGGTKNRGRVEDQGGEDEGG
jgi:hypothetical protein